MKKTITYIGISPFNSSPRMGGLRTMLYTYVFTRHNNGLIYLKSDDTNPGSRIKDNYYSQVKFLNACGLNFESNELKNPSGSSIFQSENSTVYTEYLNKLVDCGLTSEKDSLVSLDIRAIIDYLKLKNITIHDLLRGDINFKADRLGYEYIPLYSRSKKRFFFHLPTIIDESIYGTTLLIRGEDKISTAPIHEILKKFFLLEKQDYLHLPLLLDKSTNKRIKSDNYLVSEMVKKYPTPVVVAYLLLSGYRSRRFKYVSLSEFTEDFNYHKLKKQSGKFYEEDLIKISEKYRKLIK
ncbi:MAG: glutamate--tRNA ligase family protein [Minisyncoccia bacterium]